MNLHPFGNVDEGICTGTDSSFEDIINIDLVLCFCVCLELLTLVVEGRGWSSVGDSEKILVSQFDNNFWVD